MSEKLSNHSPQEAFQQRAQEIAKSLGSIELADNPTTKLKLMGSLWSTTRREFGVSRVQLVAEGSFDADDLKLFEEGQKDPEEISNNFIGDLAWALHTPSTLALHIALFDQAQPETESADNS